MLIILSNIGVSISFILGLLAIISPNKIETFVSIRGIGKEGNSEIRATYGGFFMGISLYAIITQMPVAFAIIGFGWLSASIVRLATLFFGFYSPKNVGGVIVEGVIGLLCISIMFV